MLIERQPTSNAHRAAISRRNTGNLQHSVGAAAADVAHAEDAALAAVYAPSQNMTAVDACLQATMGHQVFHDGPRIILCSRVSCRQLAQKQVGALATRIMCVILCANPFAECRGRLHCILLEAENEGRTRNVAGFRSSSDRRVPGCTTNPCATLIYMHYQPADVCHAKISCGQHSRHIAGRLDARPLSARLPESP